MKSDFMWNSTPPGRYALDGDEQIEQARINGEYQGMADQAVWEAMEAARIEKKESGK